MTWQPIATAPKDGTEILATDYDCIEIISFDNVPGFMQWSTREAERFYPCLWQPLPDMPPLPEVAGGP